MEDVSQRETMPLAAGKKPVLGADHQIQQLADTFLDLIFETEELCSYFSIYQVFV